MELPPEAYGWAAVGSVVMFFGSLAAIPFIVVRLPADYFTRERAPTWQELRHPVVRALLLALKNLLGAALVLVGVLLLVLPGQGILTILFGLLLIDFPGKKAAERWLVRRRGVARAINALRRRAGHPPLEIPGRPRRRD